MIVTSTNSWWPTKEDLEFTIVTILIIAAFAIGILSGLIAL